MGICASSGGGVNQVQAAPAAARDDYSPKVAGTPSNDAADGNSSAAAGGGRGGGGGGGGSLAAVVPASAPEATDAAAPKSAASSHFAWTPPASRQRQEAARFWDKKSGFQGFKVLDDAGDGAEGTTSGDLSEVADKTPEDVAKAREALGDLLLLSEDSQYGALFDAMRTTTKTAGDVVFKPGVERGYFYVVVSGTFTLDGEAVTFANQQGLMSTKPSEGTFQCTADGKLWLIDRLTYQNVLVEHMIQQGQANEELLAQIPTLAPLPREQREEIASVLKQEEYKKGDFLMRQGEAGDRLFFIREGFVSVRQSAVKRGSSTDFSGAPQAAGDASEVARRGPGEYIGEGSLLTDEPRIADVVAESDVVKCLSLSRDE